MMKRPRKIRGRFCERTVTPLRKLARKSLRWKKSGKAWLLVGCPKGQFKRGRCKVGTRAYKILGKRGTRCFTK